MSKKKTADYEKGFKLGKQGLEYPDEPQGKQHLLGYLDGLAEFMNDIKSDCCRIESEAKNDIRELEEEYRKIDKEETEFVPSPTCPSCGNASIWAGGDNLGHWICGVCGAEVTYYGT